MKMVGVDGVEDFRTLLDREVEACVQQMHGKPLVARPSVMATAGGVLLSVGAASAERHDGGETATTSAMSLR